MKIYKDNAVPTFPDRKCKAIVIQLTNRLFLKIKPLILLLNAIIR